MRVKQLNITLLILLSLCYHSWSFAQSKNSSASNHSIVASVAKRNSTGTAISVFEKTAAANKFTTVANKLTTASNKFTTVANKFTAAGTRVVFKESAAAFPLVNRGKSAVFYIEAYTDTGIKRAINDLKNDIQKVTGCLPLSLQHLPGKNPAITPAMAKNLQPNGRSKNPVVGTRRNKNLASGGTNLVIAGTIGQNKAIDKLIQTGKLDVKTVAGTWENHVMQVVNNPFPGVKSALVIAGSDKRGTIYGLYTLSEQIGVSPWYYWADVPVQQHKNLYIPAGSATTGPPAVKYRGIFLNDEAPALSGWAKATFGGFNHQFYEKVFELILRLKGNYLWPAMWGSAFYADDPENARLADAYGVVIGTSHHEPLMRAHDEWKRFGKGPWNYQTNAKQLDTFWKAGISRMRNNESIVTIGMRGDGDEPMSEQRNIALLEKIVGKQRNIIASITGKPASQTPQVWALYKEVQDYYDRGMRVVDDVTLLLCDDNWGNLRKLPELDSPARAGGYGIYYHFDYVGGPRNYKWINTNPITKTWEQMNLAYAYQAKQLWIVNVGDLKPMEFPISFFLDYAWNPSQLSIDQLDHYTEKWAAQQFGQQYAPQIARFITTYSKYNGRRKPELLDQHTYHLQAFNEFESVAEDYRKLNHEAEAIARRLSPTYQDAYYQLILHPIKAAANLYQLYLAVAKNHQYAAMQRVSANDEAAKARAFFNTDAAISKYYNDSLAKGKWTHMMDQTHIGYTIWQQPEQDSLPALKTVRPFDQPLMGIATASTTDTLVEFNRHSNRKQYIDLFNKGIDSFKYVIDCVTPWINISAKQGEISKESRIWIDIEWKTAPPGNHIIPLHIKSGKQEKTLLLKIKDYPQSSKGFMPDDDLIVMEAAHYSRKINTPAGSWNVLPGYGRTDAAVTIFPVTAKTQIPGTADSPVLEYLIYWDKAGPLKVACYLSPSLNFQQNQELSYGISIDEEKPQLVRINAGQTEKLWEKHVGDHINIQTTQHQVNQQGPHRVKIWMVTPGVVLQKLVVSPINYQEKTYLGPPESAFKP